MKNFHEYWSFTAMRGVFAILAGVAIVAVPRAVSSLFALPVLLGFAIGLFALYAFFDMAATTLVSQLLPDVIARRAYYVQIGFTAVLMILLFLTGYRVLPWSWLVWLAAGQAAVMSAAEFLVARSTHRQYGCLSCYSSAIVLAVSAIALPFCGLLGSTPVALALAAYLTTFGLSEGVLGSRMLFIEYRAMHPAPAFLDKSWRAMMTTTRQLPTDSQRPAAGISAAALCSPALTCATCPAEPVCQDGTVAAQIATLLSNRQPNIINSMRAATLVQAHR